MGFSDALCRSLPTLQSLLIEKPGRESMVVAHNRSRVRGRRGYKLTPRGDSGVEAR